MNLISGGLPFVDEKLVVWVSLELGANRTRSFTHFELSDGEAVDSSLGEDNGVAVGVIHFLGVAIRLKLWALDEFEISDGTLTQFGSGIA